MKKFSAKIIMKWIPIFTVMAVVPALSAQNAGSVTRVVTVPDGMTFLVDGQIYTHSISAIWPAGSKHTLWINSPDQSAPPYTTSYHFTGWEYTALSGTVTLTGNPTVVTADPTVTEYAAEFITQYAFTVGVTNCRSAPCAVSPGTVYATCLNTSQGTSTTVTLYVPANSACTVTQVPNPGWVFGGWQSIEGGTPVFSDSETITVNQPGGIWALFVVARPVTLSTVPPGLQVLADRTIMATPYVLEWGQGSTHSVGPVSPQIDTQGVTWVFSSWSDGGDATHAISVDQSLAPLSFTATYVPGVRATIATSPLGLSLTVDGRSNWPVYNFIWGVGETHQLSAPSQQTGSDGRVWAFSNWSNGGAQSQAFQVPASAAATGVRLTAVYTPLAHLTVSSSLPNLSIKVDGAACTTPCDVIRAVGTQVQVSAPFSVPAGTTSRQDFSGWSDGDSSVNWVQTLGGDPLTISAGYHLMNLLSAASSPPNGVSWRMQPASPDGFYDARLTVGVSVATLPGFRFERWSGDLSGTVPSGSVTMDSPRAVMAMLEPVPYVAPSGVGNGAGSTPQAGVAPGSLVSVFGGNLAPEVGVASGSPLPQTLGGVIVRLNGRLLPLMFASPSQINLQLPSDVPVGSATLVVSAPGQADVTADFQVVRDAPGVFQQVVDGQSYALVFHQDGTQVTVAKPAAPDELLSVYGTGFGPTTPARPDGFAVPASPVYALQDAATVQVGDASVAAQDGFAVAGSVGLDVVRFRLPKDAPTGTNAPLSVTINGQPSNTGMLPLR